MSSASLGSSLGGSLKGSSRPRHAKSKSGVPVDEMPLIQGWIARESNVMEKLLNKRYAELYPTAFVTYRKDTDPSPSKVWPLSKDVSVSEVAGADYNLRHKNTSTLWAMARGAYDTMKMWGFTITWPHGHGYIGAEKLSLAFDTAEEAERWRGALLSAVSQLDSARLQRSHSAKSEASSVGDAAEGGGRAQAGASAPQRQDMQARGTRLAAAPEVIGGAAEQRQARRAWASILHINGVAVYTEEMDEAGEGGAVMVSAVVRAPPADVFKCLVQKRRTEGLGVFVGARLVEEEGERHIVAQTWRAAGFMGSCCAPREMVLLRTQRKDEDGSYVVLYQSIKHRDVRESGSRWNWFKPVRAQVQAAGISIAPLMPQYAKGGESQEALVTMVLKADLGGLLSESGFMSRFMSPLASLGRYSLLEPVVTSIIILRDRVEQDRFVVRPLSTMVGGEMYEEEEEAAAGRRAPPKRTATQVAYRTTPLLRAQQHKADLAAESAAAARQALSPKGPAPAGAGAAELPEPSQMAELEEEEVEAEAIRGTCDPRFWSSPGDCGFKVRGPAYLTDRKKVAASPPLFELVAADLLELEEPLYHIARYLPSVKHSPAPYLLCVQLMVPSTPPISLVTSFASPYNLAGATPEELIKQWEEENGEEECPASVAAGLRAVCRFIEGEGPDADKRRNSQFKLIPNIAKGSWIIRQSVGTTPVILGQKLTTKYFRGPNYFEVDVDIGSSSVAASITNLVCGATKTLTIDLGVLVEGQAPDTLPEQLLGTVRLDKLDLGTAGYLDEVTGKVMRSTDIRGAPPPPH